jgi:hypothetical protein
VRYPRSRIAFALIGLASAACSAILDLSPPPSPDAGSPIDATAPSVDAPEGPDAVAEASSVTRDAEAAAAPVCAALDAPLPDADAQAAFHAFGFDGGSSAWALFNTTGVNKRAQFFAGGTFDGRYVYLAPATTGVVARYDTTSTDGFQGVSSWSVFDVGTLPGASAGGFSGASFDGRFVYFVPHALQGTPSGVVVRFDPSGAFNSAASWATFDTSTLVDGGTATKGFSGAGSDGRYVYFVPNNDGMPDGRVVRYDTSRSASTPSLDAGGDATAVDAGGDAGIADAAIDAEADAGVIPGSFADPTLWQTFDVSTAIPGGAGFVGAAFDGRSLYLVPSMNGGLGDNGSSGIAARFKTDAGFATPSSWSALDLTTISGNAFNFSGAAFDGRYVYFVPHLRGSVLRLDTTASQPTSTTAWSVHDVAPLAPFDAAFAPQFGGAAFDGRFVYLVPSTPGFGTIVRYDTLSTFTSDCAWSTADLTELDPSASFYLGAVFDGRYLYFIPRGTGLVARFDAKSPASMPDLPAFHGSFY